MTYHSLLIQTIRRETPETVSLLFKIPENLQADYQFVAGQYVMVKTIFDGAEIVRAYSVSNAPFQEHLQITIKSNQKGDFSQFATTSLKVGDVLDVSTPQGNFVLHTNPEQQKHYLGFATGSGITPIFSMLQEVLHNEPKSVFGLVYGNKNEESSIFKSTLDALKTQYPKRFFVNYVYSQSFNEFDLKGHIDEKVIYQVLENSVKEIHWDKFYICGQEDFKEEVAHALLSKGYPLELIQFEMFSKPKRPIL